jgi:hypothetical protein
MSISTRLSLLAAPLLALAACGSGDPTPDPDDAANAAAINASVETANAQAEVAQDLANAQVAPASDGSHPAMDSLGGEDEAPAGSQAAREGRPTTADPAAGDPLPPQR